MLQSRSLVSSPLLILTSQGAVKAAVPTDDVHHCAAVVGRSTAASDWAIVRLDRAVVGRTPPPVRAEGHIADLAAVAVIGHPFGIPAKVAGGARVQGNTASATFSAKVGNVCEGPGC